MKKYFLLAFLVFSFACVQKHTIKPVGKLTPVDEQPKSSFRPLAYKTFIDYSRSMYPGLPLSNFKKMIGNSGFEIGREAMQAGSMCVVFHDTSNNKMTLDVRGGLIQRWIINRGECGTFWLFDNYKKN